MEHKRVSYKPHLTATAWPTGSIITEKQLRASLEAGNTPTGCVAWGSSSTAAAQCQDLAKVHSITKAFALVTSENQPQGVDRTLAVTIKAHQHKLQQFSVTAFATAWPRIPHSPITTSDHSPTETKLITFRVSIPKNFVTKDRWQTIEDSPGKTVTAIVDQAEIHSAYGWKRTQLTRLRATRIRFE